MKAIKTASSKFIIISFAFIFKFYFVFAATCQDSNCNLCSSYDYTERCTKCDNGYYISYSECVKCPSNCKTCTDKCIECNIGYFITTNEDCKICPLNCDICKQLPGTKSNDKYNSYCEKCKDDYYLKSKT